MNCCVDIVVERQWHAPSLANALHVAGHLGTVFTGFPKQRYTNLGVPGERLMSHPLPALWNHALTRLHLPRSLKRNEPASLARFVAAKPNLSPVITCLATSYQHLFPKILHRPIVRVIECGSMHPEDHFLFQQRGRREAGLPHNHELPKKVVDECEASKLAHFLVCGSRMVVDSYVRRGYSPDRVLHCPYGVDTGRFRFTRRQLPKDGPLRIATVGVIGIRKGILRLLKLGEWARAAGIALELHLIGPVEEEAEALIAASRANCRRLGVLKGDALVHALHHADAYCLPSYEEGFPISQLEAMATGLPAITSADTGGKEAITNGLDGIILSQFSYVELDAKLRPWLVNPAMMLAAGNAAAEKARSLYSLDAYASHVSRCYTHACESAIAMQRGQLLEPAHQTA